LATSAAGASPSIIVAMMDVELKDRVDGASRTDRSDQCPEGQRKHDATELFYDRCCIVAQRVHDGTLSFIDAVDFAYSAAQWSGIAQLVGDDAIQAAMAKAFMGCPRR
jgi:hypothetical protein